jgi:hypothetical protein
MRHFNFFPNGGPFPGSCLSCGANKELFDIQGTNPGGGSNLFCLRCASELAEFIGYAKKEPLLAEIAELQGQVLLRDDQLNKVPNLVDGLINGIRSSVTDFIFAVSYSDNSDKSEPVQSSDGAEQGAGEAGEDAPRQRKASSKPASH